MSEIKVRQIRELVECGAKVVYIPAYTIDTTLTLYGHKKGYNSNNSGWTWDLFGFETMYIVTGYVKPRVKGIETVDGETVKELRRLDASYNIYSELDCTQQKNAIIKLLK